MTCEKAKCARVHKEFRDMECFYMIYAMITKKDIRSGALDINKYIKNHKQNEDYILVHGKINENNIIEGVKYEV